MNRTLFTILFCFSVFTTQAVSKPIKIFKLESSKMQVPAAAQSSFVFTVDEAGLREAYAEREFATSLPRQAFEAEDVTGLNEVRLELEHFSVFGPSTYVVLSTAEGEIAGPMPTLRTYRGSVRDIPGSLAMLAIDPNGNVSGFIRTANNSYTVGTKRGEPYTAYVTNAFDIDLSTCAMTDEAAYTKDQKKSVGSKHSSIPLAATQSIKVAIDVDNACYQFFGSTGDIINYLTARFAAISAVYEAELDVSLNLGRINIYTGPDPYNSTSIEQLLDKFTTFWSSKKDSVDRTIAHLISKQDLDNPGGASGLAWVAGLCRKDIGYGVTRIMASDFAPAVDEGVIAHEIGHNVGSHHTHNCQQYQPPIDSCYPAEGGCFSGTKQVTGTIMSYCNKKNFTFHPRTRTVMKEAIADAPCLGSLAEIQFKSDSIIFPIIAVNNKKDSLLTAFIKNPGTLPLTINSISIDNVEIDSEFYLKSLPAFPLTLQPNATQNVTVGFFPAFEGYRFGDLRIAHNASGGVSIVGLRGIGAVPDPQFEFELDFGDTYNAANYDTSFIYVENWGDAPLTISNIALTGVSASEFSILEGKAPPAITVPPDKTATIKIRFAPKTTGPKSARLDITHNAYDPPDNVDLIDIYANVVSLLGVRAGKPVTTASLAVSPNPATDKFTIDIKGNDIGAHCQITLVDGLGRTVAHIANDKLTADGLHKTWLIGDIANGTYQLVAKVGEATLTKQVVILK